MAEKYIGIENELISFKDRKQVGFSPYFEKLKDSFKRTYPVSSSFIRTETGHGFYVDGNEIEILTPPIALNKGFSSRLTDSLMIGRDRILDVTPELEHTGYSMHWNLTHNNGAERNAMYEALAVPFQMFGLTPLSTGFNLREKAGRYEILGDSLTKENQVNATALLLGASLYAMEEARRTPLQLPKFNFHTGSRHELFIPNGRYDFVDVNVPTANFQDKMQVQQYLELFHQWVSPFVKKLGTKNEARNLESFIFQKENLEFDDFKYFASMKGSSGANGGIYAPVNLTKSQKSRQVLEKSETKRESPLECELLGSVMDGTKDVKTFSWNELHYHDGECHEIKGVGDIYRHLSSSKNLSNFNEPQNPQGKMLEDITEVASRDKIKYKRKNDFSIKGDSFFSELGLGLKNGKPLKYLKNIGIASLIALGVSGIGAKIYHDVVIDNQVDSIISSSEATGQNE